MTMNNISTSSGLKLILKKFSVSIIFQVEPDGLICVSVNPMMSLLIILSSLTISSLCFKVIAHYKQRLFVLSDVLFLFILENKSFCFTRSYSKSASLFTFIAEFLSFPIQ